ncbi:hypothetical protein E2562_016464 [Oryza meyeriana var. granulata]|uniref:Uncharacterized protein n=1 Tax=Oryza meyeriana var. granulata TaxID=110450 RepID=A0A6G1EX75_9ORYZ|nr:hypothetical protein E2562_016464 [Oryza meyeriana var. granulata]
MGSCVSSSTAASSTPAVGLAGNAIVTAKVVFQDGSVAQLAAPATARDALGHELSCFVCCSDELRFDAPARALAAYDALRPGQLYFVLPLSALHRPMSGQDMAALAAKAIAGLGASAVAVHNDRAATVVGNSSVPSSQGKNARAAGKQRPQTARVAPLVADTDHVYGGYDAQKIAHGDRTVGKARNNGGSIARQRAGLQRLSAISEGSE